MVKQDLEGRNCGRSTDKAFILRDNLPAQPLPLDQFGELPK